MRLCKVEGYCYSTRGLVRWRDTVGYSRGRLVWLRNFVEGALWGIVVVYERVDEVEEYCQRVVRLEGY